MGNKKTVYLVSNGDFRDSAGVVCWPKHQETLRAVQAAFKKLSVKTKVLPEFNPDRKHGFVTKQCEGAAIFAQIPPEAPVVIVLSCWAYAHHVCTCLKTHRGPIVLIANFDGTWPGLVALLNHAGTLDRLGVKYSRLWSKNFGDDPIFMKRLSHWVTAGSISYKKDHLIDGRDLTLSRAADHFGEKLAVDILRYKRILGQLDPGCMGMLNAVMDLGNLAGIGMPLELLNQSDLLAEMELVSDEEATGHFDWLKGNNVWFDWGNNPDEQLTEAMVMSQMKMYSAAGRFVQRYGLAAIGIPYQLGLVRCVPASDLVEGMLNNEDRPIIVDPETGRAIRLNQAVPHFNEGDVGSGVPQILMHDIYKLKGMPTETTLHDVRYGKDYDGRFVWVFEISGAAPPAHFGGWEKTKIYRQPKMYFPKGGGTCSGVSKPGTITWARFYESFGQIGMDCGIGEVIEMPDIEVKNRLDQTTNVWPIANVHIPGYDRDQLMATHMSNHITIGYGDILPELIATCLHLGIPTRVAGEAGQKLLAA
ncbi:MAG: hypothetical protein A2729_02770 [Candidatus Buchananbacteria bacterium RIFCSPHIGHO2_01_FULL_39_14]|uniref:L-fucose isomerase C-terminal domain-containing protein n=2 Tax=Candidatus Buchananiibacteriota TaxID=1817903 RepID=A0A1G1YW56_9BACT|nr:MAG: hypothetical protein A2729_02770 [Candidatus Buchananbacteria bacterium RIFCSPHIGHO2_01_FULL_39_14]OGY49450.1 MAG: hypothetical protein A3D39_02845 [Candidatus Buchananbacteria bacterium RIFCSPHIGHO2_02_FULL_39_17]OGY55627.1 MAG: hypothetical protein A2912_05460 [Candidatus Buchananbacteria bacterium RIFCSPLOWO2_01_FULL_40_23b]